MSNYDQRQSNHTSEHEIFPSATRPPSTTLGRFLGIFLRPLKEMPGLSPELRIAFGETPGRLLIVELTEARNRRQSQAILLRHTAKGTHAIGTPPFDQGRPLHPPPKNNGEPKNKLEIASKNVNSVMNISKETVFVATVCLNDEGQA